MRWIYTETWCHQRWKPNMSPLLDHIHMKLDTRWANATSECQLPSWLQLHEHSNNIRWKTDLCLMRHPKSQLDPSLPELSTLGIRSNSIFLHCSYFVHISGLHRALASCKQLLFCFFLDFLSTVLCNWSNADYPYSQRAKEAVIRSGQVTTSYVPTIVKPGGGLKSWKDRTDNRM